MNDESGKWLEKAEQDFDDARFNLDNERLSPGVFFLQQAAEKALKAVIIGKDVEPTYTHNLLKLADKAGLPDEKTDYFPQLNNLYTGVRYPGEDIGEVQEKDEMVDSVEEVLE